MAEATIRERLIKLPPRAGVAFAARCARRAQPLFELARSIPDFDRHRWAIEKAIRAAESFSIEQSSIVPTGVVEAAAYAAEAAIHAAAASAAARAAAAAAEAAGVTARVEISSAAAVHAAFYAAEAAAASSAAADAAPVADAALQLPTPAAWAAEATAVAAEALRDAIENDLQNVEYLLAQTSKEARGKQKSKDPFGEPIDPSEDGPLGPLWPHEVPGWFTDPLFGLPSEDKEKAGGRDDVLAVLAEVWPAKRLQPLAVYVDAGGADHETIRDLFLALSALYEEQGGSGLKITGHEQRALVVEEVPV